MTLHQEVTWIVRAQYTGGSLLEWEEPSREKADERYTFCRDRASTDWIELVEVTTTTELERISKEVKR